MTEATAESLIPYDEIVQEALRAVVRRVLTNVEELGYLPGQHHFYIAFKTRAAGVSLPKHLLERYPDEMTIVLQHRYWDLVVGEDHFEVGLSFNQVPARLSIPYAAVTGFVDPAVNFALQFQARTGDEGAGIASVGGDTPKATAEADKVTGPSEGSSNIVTLDSFRKK
jgi:hypothetical protein